MSEITLKNNQPVPDKPKKKMKGWVKFLIIFSSIIIGLPVILIGVFYACFFNSGFQPVKGKDGVDSESLFKSAMVSALDYTKEEKKIRVRVTQDMLNQLLYNAMDGFKKGDGLVDNLYVEINKDNYIFTLQAKYKGIFKTKAILTTKLEVGEENIVFKITNVKVGQIGGMSGLLKFILSKAGVTNDSLTKTLQSTGLNMKADLDNLQIIYPIRDFRSDIMNKFLPSGESDYSTILNEMLSFEDFYSIIPNSAESDKNMSYGLELALDLEKMKANGDTFGIEGYEMPEGYFDSIAESAKFTVTDYLDKGIIKEADAQIVFKYYVVGYEYLNESEKSVVDSYRNNDLIEVATDTYNYNVPENETLEYICKQQIIAQAPVKVEDINPDVEVDVTINTSQIDRMLSSSNVLGSPTVMVAKGDEGYNLNYVVISRVTTLITKEEDTTKMYLVVSINISGYEVTLALSTERVATGDFAKIQFKVADMYLGGHKVSDVTKTFFMKMIEDSISHGAFNEAVVLETIDSELYVTMSIEKIYKDNSMNIVSSQYFNIDYSIDENTSDVSGSLNFKATGKNISEILGL